MYTPNQLEKKLREASERFQGILEHYNYPHQPDIARAVQVFAEIRKECGFKSKGSLLSHEISKLKKDQTHIAGLALLPATYSNLANLCAFADSCADDCVAYSGNGSFMTTQYARLARTEFLVKHPYEFFTLLTVELYEARKKYPDLAVRLNTYSDIRWERVAPWLFSYFKSIQFYDYTKHTTASRPENTRPANYHLTYSVSENTTAKEIGKNADIGRPLAVVVGIRSGKTKTGEMRPIPDTWAGLPTIDGDISDARWTTPTGSVVILRRKHTLNTNAPMIQHATKLEKKGQP